MVEQDFSEKIPFQVRELLKTGGLEGLNLNPLEVEGVGKFTPGGSYPFLFVAENFQYVGVAHQNIALDKVIMKYLRGEKSREVLFFLGEIYLRSVQGPEKLIYLASTTR